MSALDYGRYCRPALVEFLEAISLDATYERASGDRLWRRQHDELIEILDLVGGFGANLFGHHHPKLAAELQRLLSERVPLLAQGSCRTGAARLAKALNRRAGGNYIVLCTNSGTETVEAALKHAILETGRRHFWAVRGAFHGKTLGAVQMTESYREPYAGFGPPVSFLDPDNPQTWEEAERHGASVCAAFIEPISGEGGVRVLPAEFVEWLAGASRRFEFPLVADEIQCGMGRSGRFLAIEQYGVRPDYICLSKSLGGGLVKIGALMIRRDRFVEEFSLTHTSTFAEDDVGCLVALKALEILEEDALPSLCEIKGEWLMSQLRRLIDDFPDQLREVRGRGLMVGLELRDQSGSPSNGLSMISQQEYLGYLASSYLLNTHRIRVAPTLSSPFTLRIEPSAYVAEEDLRSFVEAVAMMCDAIGKADLAHLTSYQVEREAPPICDYRTASHFHRQAPRTPQKVGFIGHLLMPAHAAAWDPSLSVFDEHELERFMARPSRILGPSLFDRINVESSTGEVVHLSYYGIDLTPAQIMDAVRSRDSRWVHDKIEEAVEMARADGCTVVGLGGYTSIVTGNCKRIRTSGIALTSGNSMTVGVGLAALEDAAREQGIRFSETPVAVVGATGNIGSTYAAMLAPNVRDLVLIGRDVASPRMVQIVAQLRASVPSTRIRVSASLDELAQCRLVICASNAPVPIIEAHHLARGAVVCDVALPGDVAANVEDARPDVLIIEGGVVRLPRNRDFMIAGLPLPPGEVYACIAETLLMGLEGDTEHGTYGAVTLEGVRKVMARAQKHGFEHSLLLSTATL